MTQPRIALIEAGTPSTHIYSTTYLPRVGIPTLGALLRDLGESGPILMYTGYERGVIEGLTEMVSDTNLIEGLNALIERLVDLHPPTRDNYYHPDMLGSWSIKAVIPTVAPELNYKALEEVQDGLGAQRAYLEAIHPQTSTERKEYL